MQIGISESLRGFKVVDLGYGMAAALVAKMLAELGASVHRFEPISGDPFSLHYPAYATWHARAGIVAAEHADAPQVLDALLDADVCLIGGEDFPGYEWWTDPDALSARFPQTVVLAMDRFPDGMPATELLAQARSGLAFEQLSDRPNQLSFAPASSCAALHGLTVLLGALCARERGGGGQVVRTSLYEGALTLGTQYWMRASQPVGSFNFCIPKDPYPLVFRCRDDRYVHLVLGSLGSKFALYRILGIDDPSVKPEDSGLPTGRGDPRNFFGDIDLLTEHVARIDSEDLIEQAQAAGIVADFVQAPGECWDDPQVAHIDLIATDPAGNRHVGLPMRGLFSETGKDFAPPSGDLPLSGLRVVDLGLFVAGPYAGVALADLGADVIQVETPQGDPNRTLYCSHAAANRGKRAITVDLKTEEGHAIALRLIATAHVVLNNSRPGVSARLGVDPASLLAADPDKIVLEASGFGRGGPYGDRPGFDMIFQALCGHEVRAGGAGGMPVWDRTTMVDYIVGMIDQVAVLVATLRRLRGGGGADLETSLLDSGLFLMSELIESPSGETIGAPLVNATRTGFHPAEALYEGRDGWIAMCARGDEMAASLARLVGISTAWRTWGEAEAATVSGALAKRRVADALAWLGEAGVWAVACCRSGAAALHDGSAPADLVLASENPVYGYVKQLGALFRLSNGRRTNPRGAPLQGEHTGELLIELGYNAAEIDGFFERKIVA